MSKPTSTKPYLLRALYEWCVDNGLTPYLTVTVDEHTQVPREYVRDGEIVLNIGPLATHRLKIGNERVEFSARFGGVARELSIPVEAVAAIYARENSHGMSFETSAAEETQLPEAASTPPDETPPPPAGGRPALRRVK